MEKTHIFINCHQFLFVCYDSIYFKLLSLIFNDHILKYLCKIFIFIKINICFKTSAMEFTRSFYETKY